MSSNYGLLECYIEIVLKAIFKTELEIWKSNKGKITIKYVPDILLQMPPYF
jgi:hypothetical protein